jgi:hypothetical protein
LKSSILSFSLKVWKVVTVQSVTIAILYSSLLAQSSSQSQSSVRLSSFSLRPPQSVSVFRPSLFLLESSSPFSQSQSSFSLSFTLFLSLPRVPVPVGQSHRCIQLHHQSVISHRTTTGLCNKCPSMLLFDLGHLTVKVRSALRLDARRCFALRREIRRAPRLTRPSPEPSSRRCRIPLPSFTYKRRPTFRPLTLGFGSFLFLPPARSSPLLFSSSRASPPLAAPLHFASTSSIRVSVGCPYLHVCSTLRASFLCASFRPSSPPSLLTLVRAAGRRRGHSRCFPLYRSPLTRGPDSRALPLYNPTPVPSASTALLSRFELPPPVVLSYLDLRACRDASRRRLT